MTIERNLRILKEITIHARLKLLIRQKLAKQRKKVTIKLLLKTKLILKAKTKGSNFKIFMDYDLFNFIKLFHFSS